MSTTDTTDTAKHWTCSDDAGYPHEISAETAEEAARVFVSDTDWPTESKTYWISVLVRRDGEEGACVKVAIEPQEPDCNDGSAHAWEDGTVRGNGGGVVIAERCSVCDLQRITDTWAQCRVTGEQGLESTEYRDDSDDPFYDDDEDAPYDTPCIDYPTNCDGAPYGSADY